MTDARSSTSEHLRVWRGVSNNSIYVRVNNGPVRELPNAQTLATPQVITHGSNLFEVFHTGTDGYVYQQHIWVDPDSQEPLLAGGWTQIPQRVRTTADRSVSLTVLPNLDLYMACRSATDNQLYGVYYGGTASGWWQPRPITGAPGRGLPAGRFASAAGGSRGGLSPVTPVRWRGRGRRAGSVPPRRCAVP